jgi:hypothetical protein
VAVAAHSFSAADLLRVERVLLDALEFKLALPTPYGCLHLLTQVRDTCVAMCLVCRLSCSHRVVGVMRVCAMRVLHVCLVCPRLSVACGHTLLLPAPADPGWWV